MSDQQALVQGSQYWLILSVAAVLPILWAFTLSLHFARPYVIRYLQGLTLRFGGDVWWLSYVLIRDAFLVITLALSLPFSMQGPRSLLCRLLPPYPRRASSARLPSARQPAAVR